MIHNVHERYIAAPAAEVGALLDGLSSPDDRLWPRGRWPALRFDRPLGVGAQGGHGPIRYSVAQWRPGECVVFRFAPDLGVHGEHRFEVVPAAEGTLLRHVARGRTRGAMVLLWPLAVRWLHDALIEDAFDRAERSLGVGPAVPARWSPWVRLLRSASDRRPPAAVHEVAAPTGVAALAGFERADFVDAFALELPPGGSRDVRDWHRALVAAGTPAWVRGLAGIRSVLAHAMRLDTADALRGDGPFRVVSATPEVVVAGEDDRHLDFRAVLTVDDAGATSQLVLTTVVRLHNRAGRAYFGLVRPFHRRVVPAILRRAARRPPIREAALAS